MGVKEVDSLIESGRKAYAAGNYEAAFENFQGAYLEASEPAGFFSGRHYPVPNQSLGEDVSRQKLAQIQGQLNKLYTKIGTSSKKSSQGNEPLVQKGYREKDPNALLAQRVAGGLDTVNHILEAPRAERKKSSGLERQVAHASIFVLIAAGLFFLSPAVTGNAIGSLARSSSSWIGAVLIALGLLIGFFVLRKR